MKNLEENIGVKALAARDAFNASQPELPWGHIRAWEAVARAVLGAQPEPERTPKTVLRAMLAAYEAAALEAVVAFYQAPKDVPEERKARERMNLIDRLCSAVRRETGAAVAGWTDIDFDCDRLVARELLADYEARLRGDVPLNAPPMEV